MISGRSPHQDQGCCGEGCRRVWIRTDEPGTYLTQGETEREREISFGGASSEHGYLLYF